MRKQLFVLPAQHIWTALQELRSVLLLLCASAPADSWSSWLSTQLTTIETLQSGFQVLDADLGTEQAAKWLQMSYTAMAKEKERNADFFMTRSIAVMLPAADSTDAGSTDASSAEGESGRAPQEVVLDYVFVYEQLLLDMVSWLQHLTSGFTARCNSLEGMSGLLSVSFHVERENASIHNHSDIRMR